MLSCLFNEKRQKIGDKIRPILKKPIFDDRMCKGLVAKINDFCDEHSSFPNFADLQLAAVEPAELTFLNVVRETDPTSYTEEFLKDKIQEHVSQKLVLEEMIRWREALSNPKLLKNLDPNHLIKAQNFSFDDNIGLDIMSDDGSQLFEDINTEEVFIKTSFPQFNKIMAGGFQKQAITMLIAGTNVGKTAWKCALATDALRCGYNVLFVTLEQPDKKIKDRIVVNFMNMGKDDLKKLSKAEMVKRYSEAKKKLGHNLFIKGYGEHELNSQKFRLYLKELREKKNFIPDIVFLDYLGLAAPQNVTANQAYNLKRASEEFHAVAKEFDFAMVTSMQFNREGFKKDKPEMEDIGESFATLFTMDDVLLISQDEEMLLSRRYLYRKMKSRNPGKGMSGNFSVDYDIMRLFEGAPPNRNGEIEEKPKKPNQDDKRTMADLVSLQEMMREVGISDPVSEVRVTDVSEQKPEIKPSPPQNKKETEPLKPDKKDDRINKDDFFKSDLASENDE